jgi:hypothetical protein
VEKPSEEASKVKANKEETEEKVEEGEQEEGLQIISADEFKIHIEKDGNDTFKLKKKEDQEED